MMFKREIAEAAFETSGCKILRHTVRARNRSPNSLALIANEIGVGIAALDSFGQGKGNLSTDALKALARVLYPNNSAYDPEKDRLYKLDTTAQPLGLIPDPVDPTAWRYATIAYDPAALPPYPRSVKPEAPKPPRKLPGWAE